MTRTTTPRAPILNTSVVAPAQQARTLLACGAAAGPLYVITGVIEGLTRSGFDLRHQDLSLLSNGPLGWIHITLFFVTGSLLILGAAGTRHVLGRGGRGATWGPRLLATYGVGLLAAGLFVTDPMSGFPSGTPAGRPNHVSWHGNLHFISAAIAFLAFIVSCFVFARRFSAQGQTGWARFSVITGVLFVAPSSEWPPAPPHPGSSSASVSPSSSPSPGSP